MNMFEYIFYRLSTSSVKVKAWDYHHPYDFGGFQMSFFQTINILTILIAIYKSLGLDWFGDSAKDVVVLCDVLIMISLFFINKFRFCTKEKFQQYDQRWGNERKSIKIIKGWLVVLYCLGTIGLFGIAALYGVRH